MIAAKYAKCEAGRSASDSIEPRSTEYRADNLEAEPFAFRHEPEDRQLPPRDEELLMQIDLHRANVAARSAQAARERQAFVFVRFAGGVDNRADRAADGDAVAVAAAAAIDGAGVEAGAAANAIERAAEIGAAEQFAAAIVDEHDVQLAAGRGPWKCDE